MTRQGQFEVLWQREIGWGSSGQSRTGSLMPAGWTLTKFKYRQEDTRLDPRRKPSSATARGRSRSSWGSRTISFRTRYRTKPKEVSLSHHLLQSTCSPHSLAQPACPWCGPPPPLFTQPLGRCWSRWRLPVTTPWTWWWARGMGWRCSTFNWHISPAIVSQVYEFSDSDTSIRLHCWSVSSLPWERSECSVLFYTQF